MKLEDFLTGMSKDLKEVIKQTTLTNSRVSTLEKYKEKTIEPMVEEFNNQQAVKQYTLRQKAFRWSLAFAFGVALLVAVWNAGYWAFNTSLEKIVDEKNSELVRKIEDLSKKFQEIDGIVMTTNDELAKKIDDLDYKVSNLNFNINIEDL